MDKKAWFAVRVNTRYEFRASEEMRLRGVEPFLPVRKVRRKWSDRSKTISDPLFPGYLFGRFAMSEKVQVLRCAGVVHIVGTGRTPVPVSDEEISAVYRLMNSNLALTPYPTLPVGQRIRIENGPLSGLEGVVIRADDGKPRFVVSVALLHRSVAAEVEREWIQVIH